MNLQFFGVHVYGENDQAHEPKWLQSLSSSIPFKKGIKENNSFVSAYTREIGIAV